MRYDLLLTGGEVLDGMTGVGTAGGKLVDVGPCLSRNQARCPVSVKDRGW